ncbi:MAG: hypothetical protein WCA21_08325 [Terracidiphilus sp.]
MHGKFLTLAVLTHDMLHPMQQATASSSTPNSPSFAGLLAALASPVHSTGDPGGESMSPGWKFSEENDRSGRAGRSSTQAWGDDDLADDIATLSYESALRTHARYRPSIPVDPPLASEAGPQANQPAPRASAGGAGVPLTSAQPARNDGLNAERLPDAHFERNLKDASITIRMSKAECAQLHRRAAEAGLTVSAYLRSCTFEAESLRAMVRDTLAQMRSAAAPVKPAAERRSWFGWLGRLLTPWQGRQHTARA